MRLRHLVFILTLSTFSWNAFAQQAMVGAMIGDVTGLVEDDEGNLVAPEAAMDASVDINALGAGDLTAVVDGVASCTGGLGMQITFHAVFDYQSYTLSGFYTDIPNGKTLDQPILFENTGGLNWTASVAG